VTQSKGQRCQPPNLRLVTAGAGGSPGRFPRSLSAVRAVWRGAVRALFVWAACSIAALPSSLWPSIAKAAIRGSRFFQLKSGVRARDGHGSTKKVVLAGPDKRLAGYENFKRLPLPPFLLAFSSLVLASVDMGVDEKSRHVRSLQAQWSPSESHHASPIFWVSHRDRIFGDACLRLNHWYGSGVQRPGILSNGCW